jgi:hypothetical protein
VALSAAGSWSRLCDANSEHERDSCVGRANSERPTRLLDPSQVGWLSARRGRLIRPAGSAERRRTSHGSADAQAGRSDDRNPASHRLNQPTLYEQRLVRHWASRLADLRAAYHGSESPALRLTRSSPIPDWSSQPPRCVSSSWWSDPQVGPMWIALLATR